MTELGLIALFLIGLLTVGAVHAQAAQLLLGGPYTAVFWVLVVGLGILLPLAIQSLAVAGRIPHTGHRAAARAAGRARVALRNRLCRSVQRVDLAVTHSRVHPPGGQ